ncbi:trinucleotide repeat-containing gene 6A protein-like [Paramacrobiotus metropolitanus]|uniref:trinucleotide repeat-containing gene 6A protein-like n=1 Tax=Paramacrobiotus metropolitanus TaxID=2943436 RepID=UPI0024458869|nr:trinucleotide repeat-containing gene 6A protein-like [Paramacrobiotus metropolitanus]
MSESIADHTARVNASAWDALSTLDDLLSAVCISRPVEECVVNLIELAVFVVRNYAEEEEFEEEPHCRRMERAEKPGTDQWTNGQHSSTGWTDSTNRGHGVRVLAEMKKFLETKSQEILERLSQMFDRGGDNSRAVPTAASCSSVNETGTSSNSESVYFDANDTRDETVTVENFYDSWGSDAKDNHADNSSGWGSSRYSSAKEENDGWNSNTAENSPDRDSGCGNSTTVDDGWGNSSSANNGWDSNPARADDGWDNPTSANNGWNSNSASLEDGWGNSTSASNDLRSNSARVDDGWGNSTSVNSGWSSNSPAANDSWGKSTSADRSWGNSTAAAEAGLGNSDSMENGWTGEINGNEELITEDESTFSRDATWSQQSEAVIAGGVFGRDKSSALHVQRLEFAGYNWIVKHTDHGLELCDSRNVWVDVDGQLHLRLAAYGGKWRGASVCSEDCFGFGDYTFGVLGHLDALDPHVAFEICSFLDTYGVNAESVQVLFSRRGDADELPGEYVVQPSLLLRRRPLGSRNSISVWRTSRACGCVVSFCTKTRATTVCSSYPPRWQTRSV